LEGVDSGTAVLDTIRSPFLIVDANFRFNATENLQIYLDIVNITNELDFRFTRGIDGAGIVDRTSDFGRTFQLGVLMNF
jgi:outer membrane receptor protein involved in Fe transport